MPSQIVMLAGIFMNFVREVFKFSIDQVFAIKIE
jgi:hypothetical protein